MPFEDLENYPVVKCVDGERIICVQRKHPIILFGHLLLLIFTILTIPISFSLIIFAYPDFFNLLISRVFMIYSILLLTTIFLVIAIYLFLSWYYHFYVITNKTLVDRYSFRIG